MTTLTCWKVLEPDGYYKSFIDRNERPDHRDWMKARPITLKCGSINTAEGSATVRLGNTSLVCGIKAEIAVPDLRNPGQGFIVPNVELYPCCSPSVKPGHPGERAIVTSQFLAKIIESSNLIDRKSLCIVPNKFVWCLYCDVVCLDYDGNLTDAALLSLVAALQDTRLPKVSFDSETEKLHVEKECSERLKLQMKPTSTTFTCYSPDIHLLDPTAEDENEGNGEVTIVLKDSNSVCLTHKSGGHVLSPETLQKFIDVSKKRGKELTKIMTDALSKKKNKN